MDASRLDALLDRLTEWRIPGNDCIIIKDGKTVYRHISGFAEIETGRRMRGDETYNMWSTSKPVTAAAVLTLLERGDILLTDPVSEYLPEYSDVKLLIKTDSGKELVTPKTKINIRHLLSMSAGFSYNMELDSIKRVREETGGRCPTREIVRAMAESPLEFEPGEHWLYSICHDILGGLVEAVTGERYSDYVRKTIFEPLGMNDSTFALPEQRLIDRMARQYSYSYDRGCAVPTDNSVSHRLGSEYESGGAGLVSTVDDWPQLAGYGYGLGVRTMVSPSRGGSIGPVGEFGWAGAAGTWTMIDPDSHLAVFYAEHLLESQEEYITPRLRNVIYASL